MRPLELRMRGLRSYHEERVIPFKGVDLLAIIGDTGAGKSSLLEGITFALYGCSTWDKRNFKELISDRANTMTVSLAFESGGQEWLVTRSISRTTTPAPSHELRCVSDGTLPRVEGRREVDERLRSMIGLEYEGFCSAVLLPQGRFETLLKATDRDRLKVLRGILGLDRLGELRDPARELADQLASKREEVLEHRSRFLNDPAGDTGAAEALLAQLGPRHATVRDAASRAGEELEQIRRACQRADQLESRADQLVRQEALRRQELGGLEAQEAELDRQRAPLQEELAGVTATASARADDVATARAAGEDAASLQAAQAALGRLESALGRLAGVRAELQEHEEDLGHAQRAAQEQRQVVEGLAEQGTAARAALDDARQQAGTAESVLAEVVALRAGLQDASAQVEAARSLRDGAARARDEQQVELDEGEQTAEEAGTAVERARSTRDELARRHEGAALALHAHAGEPCPVCARALPDGFAPAHVEGLPEADGALGQAVRAARDADQTLATHRAQLQVAQAKLDQAKTTLRDAEEQLAGQRSQARELVGPADDAQLAGALAEREHAAREAHAALDAAAATAATAQEQLGDRRTAAQVELATREQQAAGAQQAAQRTQRAVEGEEDALHRARADIPTSLLDAEQPTHEQIARAEQDVAGRLERARTLETQLTGLQTRQRELERRLGELRDGPGRQLETAKHELRATLMERGRLLEELAGAALATAPGPERPARELVVWAEAALDTLAAEAELMRADADAQRAEAQGRQEQLDGLLAEHDCADLDQLTRREAQLEADLRTAQAQADRARAQQAPVEQLEELSGALKAKGDGLRELAALLSDSKFPNYAVKRRQRDLLIHASQVLAEMTGGHYGFTEDFTIVDNETGVARSPDTLSGGETFLASLALALGLVELTARSGADLDALFLDEGFGSLDPSTLDDALDALEKRARDGRLIALISHVPTVAERIDHVLQVTRDGTGSQARLLTGSERQSMARQDAAERLVG